jgi:uncharacterized protein YndB with AHSA1/START domain
MFKITHLLQIESPLHRVFEAINTIEGLQNWWTPSVSGNSNVGSKLIFGFGATYSKTLEVLEIVDLQKVQWKCTEATPEWVDTEFLFQIEKTEKGSKLYFEHSHWQMQSPLMAQCSYDWAMFLRSLRLYCESGKGLPYPNQHK